MSAQRRLIHPRHNSAHRGLTACRTTHADRLSFGRTIRCCYAVTKLRTHWAFARRDQIRRTDPASWAIGGRWIRTLVGVVPKPDRVLKRVDNRFNCGVEDACDIGAGDRVRGRAPGDELSETRTAVGMDLGPSRCGLFSIGGPRSVVNADQARHCQQRLACDRTSQYMRMLVIERVSPAPKALSDITVETARSTGIGREAAFGVVVIVTGEVDAVVMQKDPAPIRLVVVVADEIL